MATMDLGWRQPGRSSDEGGEVVILLDVRLLVVLADDAGRRLPGAARSIGAALRIPLAMLLWLGRDKAGPIDPLWATRNRCRV